MEEKEHKKESALKVNAGIEQPSAVNPGLAGNLSQFRKEKPEAAYFLQGNSCRRPQYFESRHHTNRKQIAS